MKKQTVNDLNDQCSEFTGMKYQRRKKRVSITFTEPSMAQQHMKDECDINNIMKKYLKTGVIEFVNKRSPQFGDFPSYDLKEAMQIVNEANEMFADMPAHLRERFKNSPENFLEFIQDRKNRQEAVELGLIDPDHNQPAKPAGKAPEGPKGETAGA